MVPMRVERVREKTRLDDTESDILISVSDGVDSKMSSVCKNSASRDLRPLDTQENVGSGTWDEV